MGADGASAGTGGAIQPDAVNASVFDVPLCGTFFIGGKEMVHFVGAGPGAADLITLRGVRLLKEAGQVIYAGSLVNPELLQYCQENCRILNSARMTLEEIVLAVLRAEDEGLDTVRLHTGDPSVYGAIREQMKALERHGVHYDVTPGVSSFSAAAAALNAEYTLPGVSQSLILTRMAGKTPVPEAESMKAMASHGCSMAIFLSASMAEQVQEELLSGSYTPETPAAIVSKASWPDQQIIHCTVGTLSASAKEHGITKTALLLAGDFLGEAKERSRLYDPTFSTEYREGTGKL